MATGIKWLHIGFLICMISLTFHSIAQSQEIEPRAYANLPANANFAALNYSFTTGNIVSDPAAPIKELDLNANNIVGGYVRTFSMFGKLARVQFMLPFTFLTGTAKLAGRDTSGSRTGFSDMRFRFGLNIIGSPALGLKDYVKYRDGTVLGMSIVVSVPVGLYYPERVINLGTNRWGFKPEIGLSHRVGNFYGEVYTGIWFFTANTEYLKTKTLKTDPLLNVQAQINYVFNNKMWLGMNAAYSTGGDTKVNNVSADAEQDNWRLGGVFSMPLSQQLALKLQYHSGAVVRRGSDFDFYGISIQYFWM